MNEKTMETLERKEPILLLEIWKIGDAKRHALFATTRTREREGYRRMGRAREDDLREVRYKYKPEELSLKYSVPFGIASKNSHSNPEDLTGGGLRTRSGARGPLSAPHSRERRYSPVLC